MISLQSLDSVMRTDKIAEMSPEDIGKVKLDQSI